MTKVRFFGSLEKDDEGYGSVIERFALREFPSIEARNNEDLIGTLTDEFISTKRYRVGPRPEPESEVMMREAVRLAVVRDIPIPVLIPSAALKLPMGETIDVAELSALKVLACLQDRVLKRYHRGIEVRVRMEDLTEYVVSGDTPEVADLVSDYTNRFRHLVDVLGMNFIYPVLESDFVDKATWMAEVDQLTPLFRSMLNLPEQRRAENRTLSIEGWKGGISDAMVNFLINRYKKLYPNEVYDKYLDRMAQYFATILTRRRLKATGGFLVPQLEITFANPLPDAPRYSTRLQYRIAPGVHAVPYWATKGYLRINNKNETEFAFGPFEGEYQHGHLEFSAAEDDAVAISADFIVTEASGEDA